MHINVQTYIHSVSQSISHLTNYLFLLVPRTKPNQNKTRKFINYLCGVLHYLSVTVVTLYLVRHKLYMIVKEHSYVKVVLLIPNIVLSSPIPT